MTEARRERLRGYAEDFGIALDERMLNDFSIYMQRLLEWNERINLTAIVEYDEILIKHFLDSISVLGKIGIPMGSSLLDIGSGAGFPGIPLKIVRPDLELTMLDSLKKRIVFLEAVSEELEQDNKLLHGRAEDYGRDMEYRETFDIVTARAVASLGILSEYALPFLKIGGYFIAFKGHEANRESSEAKNAISAMGGTLGEIVSLVLPEGHKRSIIRIDKISQTPPVYPRRSDKITKTPL